MFTLQLLAPRTACTFVALILLLVVLAPAQQAMARYRTPAPPPGKTICTNQHFSSFPSIVSDTIRRRLLAIIHPAGNGWLALTSATPGKARCINHYLISKTYYLVDLLGYGYARVAQTDREAWQVCVLNSGSN